MMSSDGDVKNVSRISATDGDDENSTIISKRPHIYDGDYFDIVTREKDAIIVRCRMCGPEGALLRAALTSSSNILKHVKRKHPDQMLKLKVEKKIKSRTPRTELRLKLLNSGCVKKERVSITKAYSGPTAKAKHHALSEEQNDAESDAALADLHDPDISADDNDQVYEYAFDDKLDERSIELINFEEDVLASPNPNRQRSMSNGQLHSTSKELLEFQKQLLEREYNDLYTFRSERHQLEMSILKAELAHKTIEHQKRMDILNKKLQHS